MFLECDMCLPVSKQPNYNNIYTTICINIDELFDGCNSSNRTEVDRKAPIFESNLENKIDFFTGTIHFILTDYHSKYPEILQTATITMRTRILEHKAAQKELLRSHILTQCQNKLEIYEYSIHGERTRDLCHKTICGGLFRRQLPRKTTLQRGGRCQRGQKSWRS